MKYEIGAESVNISKWFQPKELAQKIGVQQQRVSNWEQSQPSMRIFCGYLQRH